MAQPCNEIYESNCVLYTGEESSCLGITKGMNMTEVMDIFFSLVNCPNTTTTSSTTSTTSTTTTTLTADQLCVVNWSKTNLNVDRYRNGELITQITDAATWTAATYGAWCYYANNTTYGPTYGKLYNWYAVNDSRGLAPQGYHVATDAEWTTLTTCLGGANIAGAKMKEAGTSHWNTGNNGTNTSGFTGLPGGNISPTGVFNNMRNTGYFWSSTQFDTTNAWARDLNYTNLYGRTALIEAIIKIN
jgi:uncharacterized protein (TIGR02145 family)